MLCKAILDSDLSGIVANKKLVDFPMYVCHSPGDELIAYEANIPTNEFDSNQNVKLYVPDVVPKGVFETATHGSALSLCGFDALNLIANSGDDNRSPTLVQSIGDGNGK